VSGTEGEQFARTVTTTVTDQYSLASGGALGFSGGIGFATLNGSITITGTKTTIDARAVAVTDTQTQQGAATIKLPRMTHSKLVTQAYPIRETIPFSLNAVVDADLRPNDAARLLSELFSEKERSFVIRGTVVGTKASKAKTFIYATPVTPSECISTPNAVSETKAPTVKINGTLRRAVYYWILGGLHASNKQDANRYQIRSMSFIVEDLRNLRGNKDLRHRSF
jgi:hypothetical protein